mmetsp:Transcript_26765/g.58823  ORF Transcript_26765/g.58823 Transcript_26765/m.58823 type:complete len:164 (+) Transcript_26765:52-543(+)
MAPIRRQSALLPALLLAIGACVLLGTFSNTAFVSTKTASSRLTLRAMPSPKMPTPKSEGKAPEPAAKEEEESGVVTELPAPDMRMLTEMANEGATIDQDRKGNMWQVEDRARPRETDEPLPAIIFIPGVIVLTLLAIVFFAVQTGGSSSFGGAFGDGAGLEGQ